MRAKIILEWMFWISLSIFMFVAGMNISVAASALLLVAPVSLMVLYRRQGFQRALLGSVFGSAVIFVMLGPVAAFIYTMIFGVLGVVFGIISDRVEENGTDFIVIAMIASIVSKVILMAVFIKVSGVNPFTMSPEAANEIVQTMAGALTKVGFKPSDADIKSYLTSITETVSLMMPSMLILLSAADTLVTYGVVSLILKRLGSKKLVEVPPFGEWRFPKNIFWALLAALIMDFASKSSPDNRMFLVMSLNLMEVLRGIFMIEGLALCWYYMTGKGINRALKIFFAAFCILFPPISYVLSMVGIFDIWYDLRTRIRGKNK